MDVDEKVRQLKSEIEQISRAAARAEMERDQAKASVVKLREKLSTDFGVTTSPAAKELLAQLEQSLSVALSDGFAAVRAAQSDVG